MCSISHASVVSHSWPIFFSPGLRGLCQSDVCLNFEDSCILNVSVLGATQPICAMDGQPHITGGLRSVLKLSFDLKLSFNASV